MEKRIYVADDELHIRTLISTFLTNEGWMVDTFEDGDSLMEAFLSSPPDLVILDIMMPGSDGLEICTRIRRQSTVPIIIVSAKDSPIDRVTGITLGGDDYMVKPFLPLELVARVKALFRRWDFASTQNSLPAATICGNLCLDPLSRNVAVDSRDLAVTPTEFDFLCYLMKRQGQAVSKKELLKEIWDLPDYDLDTRVADDLVKRLRKKLKEAGSQAAVETIWGYGFRIDAYGREMQP